MPKTPPLKKFVDPLPRPMTAIPDPSAYPGADYYDITMRQGSWRFHQDLGLVESLTAFSPAFRQGVRNIMSFGLSDRSADAAVIKEVVNQAYLLSSLDLFHLFGWSVLLLIPICWIARRPAGGGAVAGGE